MPHIVKTQCRICASPLADVLNLGDFALSDFVEQGVEVERVPLTLAQCPKCSLVQLRHTVDRDRMYRRYWYVSGLNPSMVDALKDVVRGVQERVTLKSGDTVIDIGANDGTLLGFYDESLFRIGFDPAKNFYDAAQDNCDLFVNDYFEAGLSIQNAMAITSIAMFYDLDDPKKFVSAIAETLAPDGVWAVQMTDLVRMLRINAFDSICHEHLCYYSLPVFAKLIEDAGLRVFDLELNDVNGGSIRTYVCHRDSIRVTQPHVFEMLEEEKNYLENAALEKFVERVERIKKTVVDFVREKVATGKRFHAMGASTKGNTLLQYFRLGVEIEAAAEVNPGKYGLVTAGTGIPIISQEKSLASQPDYYLVLPWHFISFFLKKHVNYLKRGGALVVPLPGPAVHKAEETELL